MGIDVEAVDDDRLHDYRGVRHRGHESNDFFIVETQLAIERLLESTFAVRSVLVTPKRLEALGAALQGTTAPIYVLPQAQMAEVVGFDLHRGALASAARPPQLSVADIATTAHSLLVVEACNDHSNLGAMARAARALGVDALLLDSTCADPWYRRSVRVSMGELLRIPVARCGLLAPALDGLHSHGFETWALTPDPSAVSIWALPVPAKVALLVGAEGPGLRDSTQAAATRRVRIPMHGGVDSLNVGHAAAVAMAALRRDTVTS